MDRIAELQNHLQEVIADRDQILAERRTLEEEKKLLNDTLTKAGAWIRDHAQHDGDCEEGACKCGLDEVKRDLT